MLSEFLARSDLLFLPLAAMFLFLGAFLTVLYHVFFRMKKPMLDHVASLPLEGNDVADSEGRTRGGES